MGEGQTPIGMILSFVIFIAALVFVAVIFYNSPSPTGQVVSEFEEENYLGEPFELRAWVVDSEGVSLDVKNVGGRDHFINSFEIEGCGSGDVGKTLAVGDSEILEAECSLVDGTEFGGKIKVVYSEAGGAERTVEGFVKDFV
ncbi:MAG: hypothetical protein ABIH92_02870 [Nanoarchaeota archaeon]